MAVISQSVVCEHVTGLAMADHHETCLYVDLKAREYLFKIWEGN